MQSQAQVQAEQTMDQKQPWGERLGDVSGQKFQHDLVMHTHSPESQPPPGLHQKKSGQRMMKVSAPLCSCETAHCIPLLGPQNKKDIDLLGHLPEESH